MTENGEQSEELSNVEARRAAIKNGFDQLFQLEAEIKRMEEAHLDDLKKERTKLWRNLKANVNIPRKVLDLEYKRYRAVRKAHEDTENEAAYSDLTDELAEIHAALHPGEQVDWIQAITREDDPEGLQGGRRPV